VLGHLLSNLLRSFLAFILISLFTLLVRGFLTSWNLNILAMLFGNLFTLLSMSIGHCALLLIGGSALLLALWGTHLQYCVDNVQEQGI